MRTRLVAFTIVVVAALTLVWPGSAAAAVPNGIAGSASALAAPDPPIPVDAAGWTVFSWGADGLNVEGPFTFTHSGPVVVRVTDAFCRGDEFELFDAGVSVGRTSAVATDLNCSGGPVAPDELFLDPTYSHGSFTLGPGSHSITIVAVENPFGGGAAFIRVDSLPLPTSKDQCKNGGWKTFGVFKNQGDCVSFVATGGKNPPGKTG
jgi:hypothetical protein